MNKNLNYFVLGIFSLFFIIPLIGILTKVEYDFNKITSFFSNSYTHRIVYFSLYQALFSALISCIIAIPFALALNRHKKSKIIKFIISLCGFSFVLPSILIVYAVIKLFGYNGFLNANFNIYEYLHIDSIFGIKAILIAHVLLNAPFASRLFFHNLNNIPHKYYNISRSLNLTYLGNIIKLEIPIIRQNFFTVFAIIFALCFLSFAIVMALGGSPQYSTIEVAIYQYALFELNFNKAILLSFIQIIICLLFILIGFYKLKGSNFFEIDFSLYSHPHKDYKLVKIFDILLIIIFSLILFSPIILIFINFFINSFNIMYLNMNFIKAFINSLIISFLTGIIVTITGFFISSLLVLNNKNILFQQSLFLLSALIIIVSPIILSLGYFIILGELRYSIFFKFFVVILINCIFLIPFSILILFNNTKNIFLNFSEIKEVFRIRIYDFFIIIFPLLRKNLFYVFAFSTVMTFGDFTVISFFKSQNFDTLPSYLYKLISVYRFNEASFVSGFILLVSILIYFLIDNIYYQGRSAIKT